jgi:hypothetical protein
MTIRNSESGNAISLITYLNQYFLTTEALLAFSKVTEQALKDYQCLSLMPKPSYTLDLSLMSNSYFGEHASKQTIDYYAKGYPSWLSMITLLKTESSALDLFSNRYKEALQSLKKQGFSVSHLENDGEMELHINSEWQHFLSGTYGLCTRSGLPEDIAAKELAIREIETICRFSKLDREQISRLVVAINLLDEASALFAPHERLRSSRERLVNQVRRKYNLS